MGITSINPQRHLEPIWHSYKTIRRSAVPDSVMSWILDLGSTTTRFHREHKRPFTVRLLSHSWQLPQPSEMQYLGMKQPEKSLVREVELLNGDDVWLYARSIFPPNACRGKGAEIKTLGNKPLGKILFADSGLQRSEFEICKLRAGHKNYQTAIKHAKQKPDIIWGRRSIFHWYHQPVLVSEFFLT